MRLYFGDETQPKGSRLSFRPQRLFPLLLRQMAATPNETWDLAVCGDIYALLQVDSAANDAEIRRAYRQQAIKFHPDKAQDDANATRTFLLLSKAIGILLDPTKRKTYDDRLKYWREKGARDAKMDAERKALKQELLRKEYAARLSKQKPSAAATANDSGVPSGRRSKEQRFRAADDAPSTAALLPEMCIRFVSGSGDVSRDFVLDTLTAYGELSKFTPLKARSDFRIVYKTAAAHTKFMADVDAGKLAGILSVDESSGDVSKIVAELISKFAQARVPSLAEYAAFEEKVLEKMVQRSNVVQ